MRELPEEIEQYRDRLWRREDSLKVDSAQEIEAMVEEIGFCLTMTDIRKELPSIYIAICGRRDAHMPRNIQKDEESDRAWELKDDVLNRGKLYYAKLVKGNSWCVAKRMIPVFNAIWGHSKKAEADELSANARKVLKVLRKEWEMSTPELREACKFETRAELTKAVDELQKHMKVIPSEVIYTPKFTYIWTVPEARFPDEMAVKIPRDEAVLELARAFLQMNGMTLLGDLSKKFGLYRWESGRANHQLVNEGFAERLATGVYKLTSL